MGRVRMPSEGRRTRPNLTVVEHGFGGVDGDGEADAGALPAAGRSWC